jgi:hypothetical protein
MCWGYLLTDGGRASRRPASPTPLPCPCYEACPLVVGGGGRRAALPLRLNAPPARDAGRGGGGQTALPYDAHRMPLQLEMLEGGGRADRSPLRLTRPPWLEVPEGGAGRPPDPTTHGGNSLWWGIGERPGPRAGTRSSALYQPSAPARSRTPAGGTKLAPRRGAELRPVVLTSSPDELPGQGRLPGAW